MERECYDALVVGAGVIGSAIAYYFTKAGLRVALLDKGRGASEASQAAAGMLAPLAEAGEDSDQPQPLLQLCLAALHYYDDLDRQLKHETGIDIELIDVPTLRLAFDEHEVAALQTAMGRQQHLLAGLEWLDGKQAREIEPLLSPTVQGALLSPRERNVQGPRLAQAYARGAALHGARIFEECAVGRLIRQGQRVVGVETDCGPMYAEVVMLATGAWAAEWHAATRVKLPIFPVKGQMLALRATPNLYLRHTLYYQKLEYILPKADNTIYVGVTSECAAGFDKTVTAEGLATLLAVVTKIAPQLKAAPFERAWAGLRPGSADDLPLLGPSRSMPGLWVATGHFRNGILLGPLTGYLLAELIQGRPAPFDLDLRAFDPDRFGGWAQNSDNKC